MRGETEATLGEVLARLLPQLDERQRRLALGAAARVVGYGGVCLGGRGGGGGGAQGGRGARVRGGGGARARGGGGPPGGAASGCETVTRAWSRRCWRWSSRISAVIPSPRCAGPPSPRGTSPRSGPSRATGSAPIPSPGC